MMQAAQRRLDSADVMMKGPEGGMKYRPLHAQLVGRRCRMATMLGHVYAIRPQTGNNNSVDTDTSDDIDNDNDNDNDDDDDDNDNHNNNNNNDNNTNNNNKKKKKKNDYNKDNMNHNNKNNDCCYNFNVLLMKS